MNTDKRPSLPVVPFSFILLLLVGVGLYWFLSKGEDSRLPQNPLNGDTLKVFRVPGGTLSTSGLTKTEQLSKTNESDWWLGTTSAVMRVDATYRYEVELRSDWHVEFDEVRKVAFVLAPKMKPQLPAAIDTKTIEEETSSGWARFDKWDHLAELRKELSPFLEKKAKSQDYIDLARGEARQTVEEFVSDWIIKEHGWSSKDRSVVKVYFEDEKNIPFLAGKTLSNYAP